MPSKLHRRLTRLQAEINQILDRTGKNAPDPSFRAKLIMSLHALEDAEIIQFGTPRELLKLIEKNEGVSFGNNTLAGRFPLHAK
jgi:hypothetical protein